MRLSSRLPLVLTVLTLVGCATVAPPSSPPVSPKPKPAEPASPVVQEASSYKGAADAPRVLASIDRKLAEGKLTVPDLTTEDLSTYSNLLLAAGRLTDAEKTLSVLATRKPDDRTTLLSLALLAGARGDAKSEDSRVAALEKAFPGDPDAADLRARRLLAQGNRAGARAEWMAVVAKTEHPSSLSGLTDLYLDAKRPQDALPFADRAVAAAPEDDQLHALRARALVDLERYPEAHRELNRAIALSPDDPWHRLDRGKLAWLHLYDVNLAQSDLEFVVAHAPSNFFGWSALAEVYEEKALAPQAFEAWKKALSLRPDYRFAYPSTAMLAFRYQDFARAAYYAREAAKDHPGEYAFPFVEALSLRAQGKLPDAQNVLNKAKPRFDRGSAVDEMFRFLLTPGTDYYLNTALNLEKRDNVRLRLRFYQGCYYALTKSAASAKAALEEVDASELKKIPEITAARDWLDHGL